MQDSQIQNIELQLLQSQLQNEIRDKQYFQQQYLEQQQLNMQLQADLQQYAETSDVLQKQQLVSSAYFSQQIDSQRQEIDDLKLFSSSKHEKLSTHQQETQFLFNQFQQYLAPNYLYQALQSNISFNISSFTSVQILCYITDKLVSANLLTEETFWKSLSREMNTSQYITQSVYYRIVQQFCVQYTSNIDKARFERLRAEFDLLIQGNGEANGSQKLVFSGVPSQENEQINQHKTHQYEATIQELQIQNNQLQEQLNKQIVQNETLVNNGAQMGKLVFQLQSEQSALYDRISEQNSIRQPTNPIPEINIQTEQIPETNILDAPEQIQTHNQDTPLVNEIEPQNSSKRSFAERLKEKEIDLNALRNQPIYFSLNDSNIKLTPPIQTEKRQYVTKPIKRRDTDNQDNVIEVDQRENNIQTNKEQPNEYQKEAQKEQQKSQETLNNVAQPQKTPAKNSRTPKKVTSPQFEEVVSIDESSDAAQPIINQHQRNQINQHMEQTFTFTIKNILGRVYKTDIQNKTNTELSTMIDTMQPKASKDFWKELVVMAKECFDNEKMAQRYYQTQFKKVVQ
ncbi:Hypothetical_protein [Hexamita inflata]|uniref:Hypothetical_protein n=1 Tax=Hexamita inflata TaxID=28002 RepID=A0AA86ULW1_9EUKA|nr:Hypothetical protein HINF_LOCUS48254 [Hexamita inflata]